MPVNIKESALKKQLDALIEKKNEINIGHLVMPKII